MSNPDPFSYDLESEVWWITSETSEKYVLATKYNDILSDLFIGIRRFRNSVRWKEFFMINKDENSIDEPNDESLDYDDNYDESEEETQPTYPFRCDTSHNRRSQWFIWKIQHSS